MPGPALPIEGDQAPPVALDPDHLLTRLFSKYNRPPRYLD